MEKLVFHKLCCLLNYVVQGICNLAGFTVRISVIIHSHCISGDMSIPITIKAAIANTYRKKYRMNLAVCIYVVCNRMHTICSTGPSIVDLLISVFEKPPLESLQVPFKLHSAW